MSQIEETSLVWCAGLFASASTWVFNVTRATLGAALGEPPAAIFVRTAAQASRLPNGPGALVVKSHEVEESARAFLDARARRLMVSVRDPRDAIASLMTYQRHSFEQGVQRIAPSAQLCVALADDSRALALKFEDRFYDDPETPARIARHLGVDLEPAAAERIFQGHRRPAVERLVAEKERAQALIAYPGGGYDPDTNWHRHHLGRNGEIGRWRRTLRAQEAETAARLFAPFLARFGYAV